MLSSWICLMISSWSISMESPLWSATLMIGICPSSSFYCYRVLDIIDSVIGSSYYPLASTSTFELPSGTVGGPLSHSSPRWSYYLLGCWISGNISEWLSIRPRYGVFGWLSASARWVLLLGDCTSLLARRWWRALPFIRRIYILFKLNNLLCYECYIRISRNLHS